VLTREGSQAPHLRAYDFARQGYQPGLDYVLEGAYDTLVVSPDRTKLLGIQYLTDRTHFHWFDAERAALQAAIDRALPGTTNVVTSSSDDSRRHIIRASADRVPGTYYFLDHPKLVAGSFFVAAVLVHRRE
jgi:hypothetical protein